jgi:hypothetical protein
MNLSLSASLVIYIPITIAIIASSIAWRFIRHRILFSILAILIPFGLERITALIAGIYWRNEKDFISTFKLQNEITIFIQIVITPIILWRLFVVFRRS